MTNGNEHPLGSDGGTETRTEPNLLHSLFGSGRANGMEESEVFHILGNDRRREIICTLLKENGGLSVSDLARQIAQREEDADSSKNLYKSVYVSLQQTHLPKLAEKEIVVYDKDSQRVDPGPAFAQIRPYLRESNDRTTALRLVVPLLLSGLGLLVAFGLSLDIPVLETVGTPVIGVIFLLLIVVLVASQSVQ